jgi:HSP20 family protein
LWGYTYHTIQDNGHELLGRAKVCFEFALPADDNDVLKERKMAKVKTKKNEESEGLDIDFGVGKLGLGGLFKGIENLIDLAAKLKESGGEINKEGEIDLSHLKKGMKGVWGFSVKTAVGGTPVVESFGDVKNTPKGPVVEEVREPITDVFNEAQEVRIYAEMPGVREQDIQLDLKEDILEISAQNGDRKYHKEILLPAKVKPESLNSSYSNGILEVRVKK